VERVSGLPLRAPRNTFPAEDILDPSNNMAEIGDLAPKLDDVKPIDYDAAKWGRLPSKQTSEFDAEVKSQPK
jgi:hypothetical protein